MRTQTVPGDGIVARACTADKCSQVKLFLREHTEDDHEVKLGHSARKLYADCVHADCVHGVDFVLFGLYEG